jgi:hypothetical protein
VRIWCLPRITGVATIALWASLSIITLLLFSSFADLRYVYAPIESIHLLNNLPLFGTLYYVWFALLLILLFSPGKNNEWKNLALVCMFALVFSGKWIVLTHGQTGATDIFQNATPISYAVDNGIMPQKLEYLVYQEFPALAILGSGVALVTGLNTFDTITLVLVSQLVGFAALLYVLARNYLQNGRMATIAAVMTISGSVSLATFLPQYHARTGGVFLWVTFLVLASIKANRLSGRWEPRMLFVVLLAAVAATHAVTSVLLILVLLGIYLVQGVSKDSVVTSSLLALSVVVFIGYEMYVAILTFGTFAEMGPTTMRHLSEGEIWSPLVSASLAGNVGEAVPMWARVTRLLWPFLLLGLGGFWGLVQLTRIRSLGPMDRIMIGGLIGIAAGGMMAAFASSMEELLYRFLLYTPILTAPILVMFVSKRRLAIGALVGLILVFSFPTFLVHNSHVATNTLHSEELAAASFMRSSSRNEEFPAGDLNLVIFGPAANHAMIPGYLHKVKYVPFIEPPVPATTEGLWVDFSDFIAGFRSPYHTVPTSMLFSPRLATTFQSIGGIDPTTDERWDELRESINRESQVYDNGFVEVYEADWQAELSSASP